MILSSSATNGGGKLEAGVNKGLRSSLCSAVKATLVDLQMLRLAIIHPKFGIPASP
jgi:hypothetical protein